MKRNNNGLFLSFEGIANTGKSTQIKLVVDKLREEGYDVQHARSPGELVRPLILAQRYDPYVEWLLLAANRRHTYITEIEPLIKRGGIFVMDRWITSALAYQGLSGVKEEEILKLEGRINKWEDHVFFFDAPIEELRKRWQIKHIYNELSDSDYNKLRYTFKKYLLHEDNTTRIDAILTIEHTTNIIVRKIKELYG